MANSITLMSLFSNDSDSNLIYVLLWYRKVTDESICFRQIIVKHRYIVSL
jgi:hypothetical protein